MRRNEIDFIEQNGCLICVSHNPDYKGYVRIRRKNHTGSDKPIGVHRFIYEECFGDIPDGLMVCHKCDNPTCINPEHLFLGTCKDNMKDCSQKGRTLCGERGTAHKLTEKQVREIRISNLSQTKLAVKYNVSQAAIWYIIRRRNWAHVI